MSNDGGSPVSPDKRAEFFRDFIQTVLSLAAGSIVFSVTFLHDILRVGDSAAGQTQVAPRNPALVLAAWIVLLVGVVASLGYLYFHALSTKYEKAYFNLMVITAGVAIFGLVAGLVLLVCFGIQNLPA